MATAARDGGDLYAIGDVHGRWRALGRLLERLPFDAGRDRLWLVGDLVNRGPSSLAVLRWARGTAGEMGDRFVAVLGNHDLRLLALGAGIAPPRRRDRFDEILEASDRDELLDWLRERPLLHVDGEHLLVHAGLLPSWSISDATDLARRAEGMLRGDRGDALLETWRLGLQGDRSDVGDLARAVDLLTSIRTCTVDAEPCSHKGPPEEAPPGCLPWYSLSSIPGDETTVICGHWAALGLRILPGLVALDSGAAWRGELTAVRLHDRRVWQQSV